MSQLMESVFNQTTTVNSSVTVQSLLLCMGAAFVLGLAIAGIYMFRNTYTKSFVITLVLMPAIVQLIIMLVNGNIGAGIAVMGAFSLVRFRSAQGTAREISSLFLAMAVGLALGMGYIGVAAIFTLILGIFTLILELLHFGEKKKQELQLRITIPESLDYTQVFDEVFQEYAKSWKLVQVKTTNMGSMFKLEYRVTLNEAKQEKEMIDSIRCRNGNLEILCNYGTNQTEGQVL